MQNQQKLPPCTQLLLEKKFETRKSGKYSPNFVFCVVQWSPVQTMQPRIKKLEIMKIVFDTKILEGRATPGVKKFSIKTRKQENVRTAKEILR